MRRALGISVLLFGILATGPHGNAWGGGGGGFGIGFSGGVRGFSGHASSFHPFTGFRRQFVTPRAFVSAHRFLVPGFGARRGFAQVPVLYGWWPWWFGGNEAMTYLPAPEPPPQPEVIIIQAPGQGSRVSEPAPDYSYAGCHAIPNGYYCDVHKGAG